MCSEMPYEKVNTLNNEMLCHGLNHYGKSVFFSRSQKEIMPKVFEQWLEVSAKNPGVEYAVIQQYFPREKVVSVPPENTAYFHRHSTSVTEIMAIWKNPEEDYQFIRGQLIGLLKIISDAENVSVNLGYGNYSMCMIP